VSLLRQTSILYVKLNSVIIYYDALCRLLYMPTDIGKQNINLAEMISWKRLVLSLFLSFLSSYSCLPFARCYPENTAWCYISCGKTQPHFQRHITL